MRLRFLSQNSNLEELNQESAAFNIVNSSAKSYIQQLYYISCDYYYLKKEWLIWSKCFGKVLVVNGVSSVGKTEFASFLVKYGFSKLSIDDFVDEILFEQMSCLAPTELPRALDFAKGDDIKKIYHGCAINDSKYEAWQVELLKNLKSIFLAKKECAPEVSLTEYNVRMCAKAQEIIFSGRNVVMDIVWDDYGLDHLSYCLHGYPITIILLYDTLAQNLKKCFIRNHLSFEEDNLDCRDPINNTLVQYCAFYKFKSEKNISAKDFVLEKLNKELIRNALPEILVQRKELMQYLYRGAESNANQNSDDMKLIEAASEQMMILSDDEVCVTPAFRFDYIINSAALELTGFQYEILELMN